MKIPESYELILEKEIKEIASVGYILQHKKTGGQFFLLKNADPNKVFSIGFRTPPENDTGLPHIMEHSVLCGSEKYPINDPFVELAKGSLNTFLNAMTYPEKTLYPVASCNEQDFKNLMSVYMDAVFHPNIYKTEMILKQEGWHYEIQSPEEDLDLNGVVYNEMRGVFSDPDSVLDRRMKELLFPHTCYAFESGGDPESIPELTQEEFLNFHKRFYHPSNSYVYLYGDMDFYERLAWIDEAYFSNYDRILPDSEIEDEPAFDKERELEISFGISEGENEDANYFSVGFVVGDQRNMVTMTAMEVLSYALLNAPGAPIKKALLEAGIGNEIYGGLDTEFRQPVFTITVKGAKKEDYGRFKEIIAKILYEQSENGISKKALKAGLHNIEFSLREADFGSYPKGLIYGLKTYDTWIHDPLSPMIALEFESYLEEVRKEIETDRFELLVKEKLIHNTHKGYILASPDKNFLLQAEEQKKQKLVAIKEKLSEEEIQKIIEDTKALKRYQESVPSEEDLQKIPMLQLSDLDKTCKPILNEEREIAGVPVIFHPVHTAGIAYNDLYFSLENLDMEDFKYVALLKYLYSALDTEKYSYTELANELSLKTGGLGFDVEIIENREAAFGEKEYFVVNGKTLYADFSEMTALIEEILQNTSFSDLKRIKEVLLEISTQKQSGMVSAGHATAVNRVLSYTNGICAAREEIRGVAFYKFLEEILNQFHEKIQDIVEKLKEIQKKIFLRKNLVVSFTGDEKGYEQLKNNLPSLIETLKDAEYKKADRNCTLEKKNEGFMTSSMVQYAAMGGNYLDKGYAYQGSLRVLKTLLAYDYLWTNVRVKGGAYGCMFIVGRDGKMAFTSYRDPNLKETLEVYKGIPEYLEGLELTEKNLVKYIIGTVAEMDTPLTPSMVGQRSFNAYLRKISDEDLRREKEEVIFCKVADLRKLAAVVRDVLSEEAVCVVGNADKIKENKDLFNEIKPLIGEI